MSMPTFASAWDERCDRAAWWGALATVALALGLGGMGGAMVRAVALTLLVGVAGILAVQALFARAWRIPKGIVWLLPAALALLAGLQTLLPAGSSAAGLPARNAVTWNRFATVQAGCWLLGAALLAGALALTVRGARRLRGFALVAGGAVAFAGIVGATQTVAGDRSYLGLWSPGDLRTWNAARDWGGADSAWGVGPASWRTWDASKLEASDPGASRDKTAWFSPAPAAVGFGGYPSAAIWSCLAVALAPLLWGLGAGHRLADAQQGGGDAALKWWAFALRGLAALLALLAVILGEPFAAGAALFVALAVAWWLSPSEAQGRPLRALGLAALVMAGVLGVLLVRRPPSELAASLARFRQDADVAFRVAADHFGWGCGLAASSEVVAHYRSVPAEVAWRAPGWLTFTAEAGIALPATLLLAALAVMGGWRRHARKLLPENRLAYAGVVAGLAAFAAFGLCAPGPEAPIPLLAAAACAGVLAPALVGGVRQAPEGAFA